MHLTGLCMHVLHALSHDVTGRCMQLLHGLYCFDFVLDIPLSPATLIGSWFTFWLLNQWHYNQMQKLVVHMYQLHSSLGLCGLNLFSDI
jgi:hypothetical protein